MQKLLDKFFVVKLAVKNKFKLFYFYLSIICFLNLTTTASAKYLKSLCENKGFLFFGIRKNLHLNDQKNKRIFILQVYISNTT